MSKEKGPIRYISLSDALREEQKQTNGPLKQIVAGIDGKMDVFHNCCPKTGSWQTATPILNSKRKA